MDANEFFKIQGRRALVVGGGLGMGKASSQILASAGAEVGVLDVDLARAESVANAVTAAGGKAHALQSDILDAGNALRAVNAACERLGGLDILVNIVGQAAWSPAIDMPIAMFDSELTRNLRYVFTTAQAFAKLPATGNPRAIVSIASISGMNSAPNHAAYGAAKAGLMSLTRTLAQEWGPLGIRVNCIAPGSIRTDRSQGTPESERILTEHSPLQRKGVQEEIAKAVLFLASDLSSYVTGHTLLVDGGVQTNYPFPQAR